MSRALAAPILADARRRPGAPALIWYGATDCGQQTIGYGELAELADRVGRDVEARYGQEPGPLALVAVKSTLSIATVLACLANGRPLLLLSPELGEDTRAALVLRAGARAVLTPTGTELTHGPLLPRDETAGTPPADTALILTTSGSTGLPKLVPLPASALEAFTAWAGEAFTLDRDTRVLNYAPLNFDLCLLDIWATLRHGGCVVPVPADRAVDGAFLDTLLRETRPHVVQAVPLFFRLLLDAAEAPLTGVRDVLLTGDHVPRNVRARLPELFPQARLHNVYGCTETNDSMVHTFGPDEAAEADVLPLGRPLPGVSVRLLGPDGETAVEGVGAEGVEAVGELVVSTPFQTHGYLADDRSAERFERRGDHVWYRTGDLVRRDADGLVRLVGRTDFQVKVRGVRVNLEEVERVLGGHADVAEAAVVALPDDEAGKVLHAFVRPAAAGLTGLGLRTHCAARLNRLAIPARFHLVDEPLPVGPTGKTDRRRLEERLT
ncbi:AMP-binding protein [Streptacidiphilus jiangxiensis]|uniref:Acyl-CoA synthetase (AMP-forming)/AMP-acid ligase II n=1 Tax=Streptacidiphilus jiangxiensis TaxID=235985 RepID=A0A1H7VMB3_STRJI|nr:AMP-binding protein [Streptacidiphilus jiangxiensis]SEM09995.1 Acyl-CoA synthetase (AMP-forming)/AMP-acid ligase II [Streptacidiphilus jiangxiensis]